MTWYQATELAFNFYTIYQYYVVPVVERDAAISCRALSSLTLKDTLGKRTGRSIYKMHGVPIHYRWLYPQ